MIGRLVVLLSLFAVPAVAHADADEASLHVQLVGGVARLGDEAAEGATATAPLAGVAGRFSYATADWFQYDAQLTLAGTGTAAFDVGTFDPPQLPPLDTPFDVAAQLARVDAGVTLRLGVRYIPTARLALGAQARRTSPPSADVGEVRDAQLGGDLVATAAFGFDYRINRRTIVGISAGGSYAVPLGGAALQTVEGQIFYAYYWYPQ